MITLASLQARSVRWARRVFGSAVLRDRKIRALRLVEEAVEFAQAVHVQQKDCEAVIRAVYVKPPGEPSQEIAGVMITTLAAAHSVDCDACSATVNELHRVNAMPDEHFRNKQALKVFPDEADPDDFARTMRERDFTDRMIKLWAPYPQELIRAVITFYVQDSRGQVSSTDIALRNDMWMKFGTEAWTKIEESLHE